MHEPMRIGPAHRREAASACDERVPRTRWLERELAALAQRQHGVAARIQLLRLGFSPGEIESRIAAGRLNPMHRGVYAVGHRAVTRKGQWLAAVLAAGQGAALSHRDAAALWGISDFTRGGDTEVTLPGTGTRAIKGIRVHRSRDLAPPHVTYRDSVPVTTVARTLLDLAGAIGTKHLRQCHDAADRLDLLDMDELGLLLQTGRGHRGVSRLAHLTSWDRTQPRRARSMLELDFLAFCREESLPEPLVNHTVEGFEVDACWPGARLVVELDSWEWHRGKGAFERDRAKASDLQVAGFTVLPVTDKRLRTERKTVARSIRTLLSRTDAA